jgi:hypothetical protein
MPLQDFEYCDVIDLAFRIWRSKQKRTDHALLSDIADSIEHHGWRTFFVDEFNALRVTANNITSRQMQAQWARELEEFVCKHIKTHEVAGKALAHALAAHEWLSGTHSIDCVRLHILIALRLWPYASIEQKQAAEAHYRTAIDLADHLDGPVAHWWRLEAEAQLANLLFDLAIAQRGHLFDSEKPTTNMEVRTPDALRAEGLRILKRLMAETLAQWGFGSARHLVAIESYVGAMLHLGDAAKKEQLREGDELISKVLRDSEFSRLEETSEKDPEGWNYEPDALLEPDFDDGVPLPYRYQFLILGAEIAERSGRLDQAEDYLRETYAEARTVPADSRADRRRLEIVLTKLERFFHDHGRGTHDEREKIQQQLHRLYRAAHNERPHLARSGFLPALD